MPGIVTWRNNSSIVITNINYSYIGGVSRGVSCMHACKIRIKNFIYIASYSIDLKDLANWLDKVIVNFV